MTAGPAARERIRPVNAGWYAGEDVWASCYGPAMVLAADARRLDVSPAWFALLGAVPALELAVSLDGDAVREHAVALADRLLELLDRPPEGSAIVRVPDPDGAAHAALASAGIRASARAGGVRLSPHVGNDEQDVERAAAVVRAAVAARSR